MATSVLDARDTRPVAPETAPAVRRLPATVVGAAAIALLEAVALLAGALTGLDGVLTSPDRPSGGVVVLVLLALASWIVGCAGGAATLVDGAGRGILAWVAHLELALVALLFLVGLFTTDLDAYLPRALPLPAVALLALALPVGKLLLAGAPTAVDWVAAGPRPRERRPDPVATHRGVCVATLAVIGVVLGAVALLGPTTGGNDAGMPGGTVSSTR
ncbi:hypothetical protein ACI797_03325 [Geodermatophilus sp. SYSU D00691]